MMRFYKLFLLLFCLNFAKISYAQISIAEARLQAVGAEVTVRGVVTNGSELGIIRYIEDPTAGIALYFSAITNSLNPGDSVVATGILDDFAGLLELNPISELTVVQTAVELPTPQVIENASLNESLESELVRLNGVVFQNGGSPFSPNTSYNFTQGSGSGSLYIRTNSPLVGFTIPVGTIDLIGICSEFNGNYQMLARTTDDFILPEGINIVSQITVSDFQQTTATVNWETNIPGSTSLLYGKTPLLELGLLTNPQPVTNHSYTFQNLEPGHLYYFIAFSSANGNSSSAPAKVFGTVSNSSGNMKTWFNHPVSNYPDVFLNESIDDTLIQYINQADSSIDVTIYDFVSENISSISEALNAAHNRGVRVRFISDGNLAETNTAVAELLPEIPQLLSPVGGSFTIMHNKFVVIDANHTDPNKPIVWTGSTNWTDRQINRDPNHVIVIQDQTLARTYQAEFDEMWGSSGNTPNQALSKFGNQKTDNTPHEFKINGKRVECYFSPSDNTNNALIRTLQTSNDSLVFATMLITRDDIREAIDTLIADGVNVRGLINSDTTTLVYDELLLSMGSNLFVNADTQVIMHHKYFVADAYSLSDPLVWTGSHNWSTNANTRNDENSIVVHDADLAQIYHSAFQTLISPDTEDTTSVQDVYSSIEIKLFPSLAKVGDPIYLKADKSGHSEIQLYDLSGNLIETMKINYSADQASILNFGNLNTPGFYLVRIGGKTAKLTLIK